MSHIVIASNNQKRALISCDITNNYISIDDLVCKKRIQYCQFCGHKFESWEYKNFLY